MKPPALELRTHTGSRIRPGCVAERAQRADLNRVDRARRQTLDTNRRSHLGDDFGIELKDLSV